MTANIIFIDSRVAGYQGLIDNLTEPAEVFMLDGESDGLTQMAALLQGRTGIDAIHVISHGSQGALYLGSMLLTSANLATYAAPLASIGSALTTTGDILLYGCNVAQGDVGQAFIAQLAAATGADVAASVDATGGDALGGNWQFEAIIGFVETKQFSSLNSSFILAIDTTPPALTSLIFPATIDVSQGEQSVVFGAHVDESGSGPNQVIVYFDKSLNTSYGNSPYSFWGLFDGSTGTTNDPTGTYTVRTFNSSGVYQIDHVTVSDLAGNSRTYSSAELQSLNIATSFVINDSPTGSVTITGTATQGQTLTASNTLTDVDGLGVISYQWLADGTAISDATADTIALVEAHVGKAITVTASYTDGHDTAESMTSSPTAAVANVNDAPTGSVTISGIAAQGRTLTVTNNLADPDGIPVNGTGAIGYQWQADGIDISGATSNRFTLTEAQVGKVITVAASYSDGHSTPESGHSGATSAVVIGDIVNLDFEAGIGQDSTTPFLSLNVELSADFSDALSIQLLYWAVNNEQTWITLSRSVNTEPFITHIDLPYYAMSGDYEIRSIRATDNTGTSIEFSREQLIERELDVNAALSNPLADNQAPSLDSISFVGGTSVAIDGTIHLQLAIAASDANSGLNPSFLLEINSPTGASLQQWATLDADGHALVDFSLSPYSASGQYQINTVRLTDLAGNYNDAHEWLGNNTVPIQISNANQDTQTPSLQSFTLGAIFDPTTDRPRIVIGGTVVDDVSGVKGVYLRLDSPVGSSAYLDTWVYQNYYAASGTHQTVVNLDAYKALTVDFLPGEYIVNFLRLGDSANNEIYLYANDLLKLQLPSSVRVYFPDPSNHSGSMEVFGSDKPDYIFGSDSLDDVLHANAGNDYIFSGKGNDWVDAGEGDDVIVGGDGAGDDTYIGGPGIDTVRYTSAITGIAVNLEAGTASGAEIGNDTLSVIENVIGGQAGDVITGNSADNVLDGYTGNDTLDGGAGTDTASYSGNRADYTITAVSGGYTITDTNVADGNDGTDSLTSIERLAFADLTMNLVAITPLAVQSPSAAQPPKEQFLPRPTT